METFKITFKLLTPIAFIDIPTFDGILSYAFAKEKLKGQKFVQKLNISKNEMIDFSKMPINMHKNEYFMASRMFWDENKAIEHIQRWRKRWANKNDNITDFGKQKRKVAINKGEFKSYDMPLRVVAIDEVWFYFQTKNVQKIKELIKKYIYFLGKKKSQGYGEIKIFDIVKSDFDFTDIFRPIPVDKINLSLEKFKNVEIRYCAWRPPYWLSDNFDKCVLK